MNPQADKVTWIIGNDDSVVFLDDEEQLNQFSHSDFAITEGLGLLISSKTFVSEEAVFFEEYESPRFRDKSLRYLLALVPVVFAQNRT